MGTCGTGLYSNDSACDIRGDYIDKLKRGKTNDEATQELINSIRDIMGDERVVEGTILMVDLANSIVKLKCD